MIKKPKLKKKYGKLTVLDRYAVNHRGMALCRCTCGRETEVRTTNLIQGVSKSCGAPQCRSVKRAPKVKGYQPYGPRAMSIPQVKKLWALYVDPDKGLSVIRIAEKLKVNRNTAYSAMRAIRQAGGLDAYLKKVA